MNNGMSEKDFTNTVIAMAKTFHWLVHHQRPGRMADGRWRSSIQGHKGFPDLVLAKDGIVIFAELKSETGRLRPEQKLWLKHLDAENWCKPTTHNLGWAPEVCVWRPSDLDRIEDILRRQCS